MKFRKKHIIFCRNLSCEHKVSINIMNIFLKYRTKFKTFTCIKKYFSICDSVTNRKTKCPCGKKMRGIISLQSRVIYVGGKGTK